MVVRVVFVVVDVVEFENQTELGELDCKKDAVSAETVDED